MKGRISLIIGLFALMAVVMPSCGIYTFRDISIPADVKTIKIDFIENKARIVNPQLSPKLTEQFQQKVSNQTKLTRTNNDDAHYHVSAYITNYSVSTSAVSQQQAANNRLTVGVHIILRKNLEDKTEEFDISRDFEFAASMSFTDAENKLMPDIVKNLSDEMFNRIFSNW